MNASHAAANVTAFVGIFLLSASPARAEMEGFGAASLAVLNAAPGQAGELIYRGSTFAQASTSPEPLFHYERRLKTVPSGFEATHLTRDPAQQLVVVESSRFDADYRLQKLAVKNQQLGYSGTVQVSSDGRHLKYRLNDQGVVSTAEEAIDVPAVSGPSLFGFILAHRPALAAGQSIPVRFIVMKEKQTYGFDIRQDSTAHGQVVYAITASSWLIRPFIATMRVTWDADHQTWVRYKGRVPPMQTVAGKLTELDARVDYTAVAATYR